MSLQIQKEDSTACLATRMKEKARKEMQHTVPSEPKGADCWQTASL